jgi:pre-mRNA-splicing factor ATP-dependent RNA helicase DHX38/PRP16
LPTNTWQWLADLGGVFYSVKEKGYSVRDKRVTEQEFNRKMEIEAKMADDKEREAQRLAKAAELGIAIKRPVTSAVKRVATQGAVKRPLTPRVGRGF